MAYSNILKRTKTSKRKATLLTLSVFFSAVTAAKDYQVEAIIFENLNNFTAYESTRYRAVSEQVSRSKTWALDADLLVDDAKAIAQSPKYRILGHYSWGQEALPTSEAAVQKLQQNELHGWIKVYASHLLFANVDINFKGFRMTEKRRLKLNEKHFFDHPKFGILLQVSRLQDEVEPYINQ